MILPGWPNVIQSPVDFVNIMQEAAGEDTGNDQTREQ